MEDVIRGNGETVELFGVQFPLPEAWGERYVEHLRSELIAHFEARVATPDAEVWQQFREQARAQLERHACLDGDLVYILRATIDGL